MRMQGVSFINLDTTLRPSRYRLISWLLLVIGIAWILGLMPLPASYRFGLIVLLWLCAGVSQLASSHLLAISSLPAEKSSAPTDASYDMVNYDWQLQWVSGYLRVPWGQSSDVYQARLHNISKVGVALIVEFQIISPQKFTRRFVIWKDQLSSNNWRQLSVLAQQ